MCKDREPVDLGLPVVRTETTGIAAFTRLGRRG
jgi:hypothetical protein